MKALIAATCVALLAATGYFFYGEYADAKRMSANAENARSERAVEAIKQSCQIAKDNGFRPATTECRQYGF